jgi:hypothetical protein
VQFVGRDIAPAELRLEPNMRFESRLLSWANEVNGAEEAYVRYSYYCRRRRLRHTGRHQHSCDVGSFQASRSAATRNRLIAAYRAGGYLFVILLSIMGLQPYSMSQRLVGVGISGHLPAHLVLHLVLVLGLVPLLFLKILIARRYKQAIRR